MKKSSIVLGTWSWDVGAVGGEGFGSCLWHGSF